jgi:hypothetical protein
VMRIVLRLRSLFTTFCLLLGPGNCVKPSTVVVLDDHLVIEVAIEFTPVGLKPACVRLDSMPLGCKSLLP